MKPRHTKTADKERESAKPDRKRTPVKVDELEIERGQNAEKGNTFKRENIRHEDEAAH